MTPQIPSYLVDLAKWGMNGAFWSAVAFWTLSGGVWPWWKSFWGINLILLDFAINLAMLSSILQVDFGIASTIWLTWLSVVAIWLVGIIIIWRGFLVISTQIRNTFGSGLWATLRRLHHHEKLQRIKQVATKPSPVTELKPEILPTDAQQPDPGDKCCCPQDLVS